MGRACGRKRENKESIWIHNLIVRNNWDLVNDLFKNVKLLTNGCWIRGNDLDSYTHVEYNNKRVAAHRVSYELFTGNQLKHYGCHSCDTPACINPSHIFDGTNEQNLIDAWEKDRMLHTSISRRRLFKLRVDRAERKLRKIYPNVRIDMKAENFDLPERLKKATSP